ncbi:hypothetical protein HDU76_004329, partial [Blyttiomyces sp. JEL0837]
MSSSSSSSVPPSVTTNDQVPTTTTSAFPGNNISTVNVALDAVLKPSIAMPETARQVKGYDFNNGINYKKLISSMVTTGFQASAVGDAIEEINRMIKWRLSDEPITADETTYFAPEERSKVKCKIFLGYTSNLVSSGLREVLRYLVEHKMVDVIVASAGGVEEDIIKCLGPTYLGSFSLAGADLRTKGLNRIGNLLVPNANYCAFEDWVMPVLDEMLEEQRVKGTVWTPSKMIHRLGQKIDDPSSIAYWAYK